MLSVLLFSCFLLSPILYGIPVDNIKEKTNSTSLDRKKVPDSEVDVKKITVASEGGAIFSNTPIQSLPKENPALPISSAAEIRNNKVKARKGANDYLEEIKNLSAEQNSPVFANSSLSSSPSTTAKSKPLILSAEAIAKSDLSNNDPAVDDINERMVKIHKMNTSGHPGMIMPVVITVLVVPVFAVIGFMALKRGKEAWKNRHYKRMDFLLDGMYND